MGCGCNSVTSNCGTEFTKKIKRLQIKTKTLMKLIPEKRIEFSEYLQEIEYKTVCPDKVRVSRIQEIIDNEYTEHFK